MSVGLYSITILQGSTFRLLLQYLDTNGNPVNLNGYHSQMQIRPDYADNTNKVYVTLSSSLDDDGNGIIMEPTEGKLRINITAQKTETFDFEDGLYDLELYSGSFTKRLMQGKVRMRKEVTRDI